MNFKTIGAIEILGGSLFALFTLITAGASPAKLYIIAAALFISGHILVAAAWRQNGSIGHRHDAFVLDKDVCRQPRA